MKTSDPTYVVPVSTNNKVITLYGNMFKYQTANGLYLSSNKTGLPKQRYDFYSGVKSVSANNPPFSGIPVDNFIVYNNNVLQFTLSAFKIPQKLDIIYANPAGHNLS